MATYYLDPRDEPRECPGCACEHGTEIGFRCASCGCDVLGAGGPAIVGHDADCTGRIGNPNGARVEIIPQPMERHPTTGTIMVSAASGFAFFRLDRPYSPNGPYPTREAALAAARKAAGVTSDE